MTSLQLPPDFHPRRILIIRLARLGDVILMFPAIRALRSRFPKSHLAMVVGQPYAPVLEMCSAVDEVIAVDRVAMRDGSKLVALRDILLLVRKVRSPRFDLVLDFHSFRETNLLSLCSAGRYRMGVQRFQAPYLSFCFNLPPVLEDKSRHVAETFLSLVQPLGALQNLDDYQLDFAAQDVAAGKRFCRTWGVSPGTILLGMNVGAGSPGRTWPPERFAELADLLSHEKNVTVVVFSGPGESHLARAVVDAMRTPPPILADELPLRSLAAAFSQCRVLLSNDTGPMHLAAAAGVPTLGLFSLSSPDHYRPLGPRSRHLRRTPIQDLTAEEVHAVLREMLRN
ncbi:MAG: glycosyltransferase family 9 protein [Acidobacteriota bacterium]